MKKYTYEEVCKILESNGYTLLEDEYINCKQKLHCKDNEGYDVLLTIDKVTSSNKRPWHFHKANPYSISNINHWAELNKIQTRCISEEYINSDQYLEFKCECGNKFFTTRPSFMDSNKIKCDKCTGYNGNLTYVEVKSSLETIGYYLDIPEEEYEGVTKTDLNCHDNDGYKYKVIYDGVMRGKRMMPFHSGNPYTIHNINHFLEINQKPFRCISKNYINSMSDLEFECLRCHEIIQTKWSNIHRIDTANRSLILCPNCDGRTESLHAIVLKQLFSYNYPDTVEEDPSVINPKTNKIMPTDIVNHRLKIAIEIQSQWHDYPDIKQKDLIKKNYWINRGYSFYDPDIRDYSVLEMCRLFFDIQELPDYINYDYKNKLNIKIIQDMLNKGKTVPDIANELQVSTHRIYDAIGSKKIQYPENYQRADWTPVIQFDLNWKYIKEYSSYAEAGRENNILPGNIASAIAYGRHYSSGFYWMKKEDYIA